MGKRGPNPTPTVELERRGSWRADTRSGEPRPAVVIPDAPESLDEDEREIYEAVAAELEKHGLITLLDGDALAYGVMWDRVHAASMAEVRRRGVIVACGKGGERINPAVYAAQVAFNCAMKIWREFGRTPSARTGVSVSEKARGEMVDINKEKAKLFSD